MAAIHIEPVPRRCSPGVVLAFICNACKIDRTHVGNVAAAYDLGRLWRAGARFTLYTGTPVVPPGGNALIPPPRSLSPDRDPTFYRLDLRLEKRWTFGEREWLAFVVEFLNATLHPETISGEQIGPVAIPSIGLEGGL